MSLLVLGWVDSFQRGTLALWKGITSGTNSLYQLCLLSMLLHEAGPTEEKTHVTCVPQQQKTGANMFLFLPQLSLEGSCLAKLCAYLLSTYQIRFVVCQGHLFHVLDGVLVNKSLSICLCLKATHVRKNAQPVNFLTVKVAWACYVERLCISRQWNYCNLCRPSTSLVLLAPFVWLTSKCDALQ